MTHKFVLGIAFFFKKIIIIGIYDSQFYYYAKYLHRNTIPLSSLRVTPSSCVSRCSICMSLAFPNAYFFLSLILSFKPIMFIPSPPPYKILNIPQLKNDIPHGARLPKVGMPPTLSGCPPLIQANTELNTFKTQSIPTRPL